MDYLCPMHTEVRQRSAGKCPKCGMALLPQGTRFAMLQHVTSSPLHLAVMVCRDACGDGGGDDADALSLPLD